MATAAKGPSGPVLAVTGVSKSFPGVRALDDVALRVDRGEVVAVIGENGAGKSTLMKILGGVLQPDAGELRLDDEVVRLDSVIDAQARGIALIHQELNLCENLSVAANLFLGREPRRSLGRIDEPELARWARAILDQLGSSVALDTLVGDLPIGQRQLVEIGKALSLDARVIIMDEPTSSLSRHETDRLIQVVAELRARGVAVVYISHRLAEVELLADRVVVLRDGQNAGELAREQISHDRMVALMVGRELDQLYQRHAHEPGDVVLGVRGLATPAHADRTVDLEVRRGEIVGIAGLVGAGRTELLRAVFGIDAPIRGRVEVDGRTLPAGRPAAAIAAGVALVPEDRKAHGLILDASVGDNIAITSLASSSRYGFVRRAEIGQLVDELVEALGVKTPSAEQVVRYLSGGNQQKCVLAKWLARGPSVLLLDEPTRGIDVGAKAEIYGLMDRFAADGVAIVFASSELEELLGVADRIVVMHDGKLAGELARADASEEAIMRLATGSVTPNVLPAAITGADAENE